MDYFRYENGELHCERVPMRAVAEQFGTPTYVYSKATLLHHYRQFVEAFSALSPLICYSVKSCSNLHILRLLRDAGSGFDAVSGGELYRLKLIDAEMSKVNFAGVGKTPEEIAQALQAGIGYFNVESEPEFEQLHELSRLHYHAGRRPHAALRINPDVDPHTHRYTATGKRQTKFGVDLARAVKFFRRYGRSEQVHLDGIHLHIGSPVNNIAPYVQALTRALELIGRLRHEGFEINTIDIGGGYGAHYHGEEAPSAAEYARAIVPLLQSERLQVLLEPGRSIAANAGILLARVIYVKQGFDKQFVITDASMTDLIRPALYEAFHFIWPVAPKAELLPPQRRADMELDGCVLADVVGPVCESGDFLGLDRYLPPMEAGELLAVFTAGAYGFVMSSNYNTRPRAAEVLVDGDDVRLIRRRESYADITAPELELD